MELIGAGLHREADDAVPGLTKLGQEITLKDLKLLDRVARNALVPLSVRRNQRDRNAVDQHISSTLLPPVDLEVVSRVAAGIISHISNEARHQRDELHGVADGTRHLQTASEYPETRWCRLVP